MSNRKGSSEFRRQLEGLGFQDSRNVREEQRRRELINNISLEYNLDVDENQSVEVLEEKYKKLQDRKRQEEKEKKKKLELQRQISHDFGVKVPPDLTVNQLKKLLKDLKNKVNTSSGPSISTISSAYGSSRSKAPSTDTNKLREITLDNFEEYEFLKINHLSKIKSDLLNQIAPAKTNVAPISSNITQNYVSSANEVELVMGIDFGTTNTKVVIQETGSKQSWAIPFTDDENNPYLLPSNVFLTKETYTLNGDSSNRIGELKLPLIKGSASSEHLDHVIAYIALIIRHAREWFLENAAKAFYGFEFEWRYKMGLPAENNDNKKLVSTYKSTLTNAVKISLADRKQINQKEIDHLLQSCKEENIGKDCNVHPEIQAQLGGYTESDHWDPSRVKVMMVDVGGGTVDASIINVTENNYDKKYSCLKTKVDSLGVYMLHKKRLEWLEMSAHKSVHNSDKLLTEINLAKKLSTSLYRFPNTIEDYISDAIWPDNFSLDHIFFNAFHSLVHYEIIQKVKNKIDPRNAGQWKNLRFILCGGGSLHPLFKKIANYEKFDPVKLKKPSKLEADITDEEYHRISVAYGLSFEDQGWFVNESEIDPIQLEEKDYTDRYTGSEMV